jgi:coenzyme F420 biosynthesis associated uncharacterized protein
VEDLGFIDWDRARKVGGGLVPPGPKLAGDQIAEVVSSLRECAGNATAHVAEVTQLSVGAPAEMLVLDRSHWIAACCATAQVILGSLGSNETPAGRMDQIKGTTRGVQLGVAFAAVATRILGQFDPFGVPARLLLVAPNICQVEHELMVDPQDFRLWVCLHEETHRFQFGHAPWLRDHILASVRQMLDDDEGGLTWPKPVRGKETSILDVVLSPEQRTEFDRVSAVMSLMEGHADVMMDRVGTAVVPTLPIIRRAFEARRDRGGWAALVGKLIGNDLKLAQYRDGAQFCRQVIDQVDVPGLNAAFAAVENLPSMAEIHDPSAWVKRVHG